MKSDKRELVTWNDYNSEENDAANFSSLQSDKSGKVSPLNRAHFSRGQKTEDRTRLNSRQISDMLYLCNPIPVCQKLQNDWGTHIAIEITRPEQYKCGTNKKHESF